MKFKKFGALTAALALSLSLAACGSDSDDKERKPAGEPTSKVSESPSASESPTDTATEPADDGSATPGEETTEPGNAPSDTPATDLPEPKPAKDGKVDGKLTKSEIEAFFVAGFTNGVTDIPAGEQREAYVKAIQSASACMAEALEGKKFSKDFVEAIEKQDFEATPSAADEKLLEEEDEEITKCIQLLAVGAGSGQ